MIIVVHLSSKTKKSSILGWLKVLKLLKKIASDILKNQDSLDFLVSLHSLNILALKVQLFSEGHKNWANLPLFIRHYLVASNYKWIMGQSFVAFTEYLNFENKINIFLFFPTDHPLVRKLGFTGSTPVGKTIMKSCATSNLKKASLELGGKSPLIIFGDFDLDRAVKIAMGSVFFNKGENCIAAGRIFVEETIYDEFLQKVVDETKKMKIGDPLDRSTAHGPQNHRAHLQKLVEYCQTGVEQGEYVKKSI